MQKNILENLELRLIQTRLENSEKLDLIETEFKEKFGDFLGELFKNDNLGFKRFISVNFQLEKLDNPDLNNVEIFKKSLNKAIEILTLNKEKKEKLGKKITQLVKTNYIESTEGFNSLNNTKTSSLDNNKSSLSNISEKFIDNSNLHKDKNFPILESLEKANILDKNDLVVISLKFKETKNFLTSIGVLGDYKKSIIKTHFFELNNTKSEDRIENFKNDFSEEIEKSENIKIYPKVLKFIGKNYFKLRLKNKIESKKDRLKRMFKIAFLKLYRLKYSGIDITNILNKIDGLDDLDSMINLLLKFFEQLKQNPNLQKDYIVSDEIDEIEEIGTEAEENKEKILFSEENIIKASSLLELGEKKLGENNLDLLLDDDVDLIGNDFIQRNKNLNSGILYETITDTNEENGNLDDEDEINEEHNKDVDLNEFLDELKNQLFDLEDKKRKLFLSGDYDLIDELNEQFILLNVKINKLSKLLFSED